MKQRLGLIIIAICLIATFAFAGMNDRFADLELVDVTATADEINILDGVTATAAEINLLDGLSLSGSDTDIITGTAGTDTYTAKWNSDGDLVDGYAFIDDDSMATASSTNIPSGESVKAYVDAEVLPKVYLTGEIADASSAASSWVVSPVAGDITRVYTVLEGAITVADAAITFEIATVAVTDGGITIGYSGSAAGDIDTSTPSAARTVTAGQAIEILTDGGSTDAAKVTVVIEITPSATTQKKYVIGEIADISTGASSWTVAPVAGTISKIWTVIDGAIITVDAGISFELGGTAVTDGGITIAFSGSAAGTVDSAIPTALNVVTAGQAVEIITDGASTNAVKAVVILEITPS